MNEMQVIVGGINLEKQFGVILDTENSEFNPPEVRTNYLSIPGMDGMLDLTESLVDDTNYEPRHDVMVFGVMYPRRFEETKTKLLNILHGREVDYELTWEPGYTYHGRFAADTVYSRLHYGEIRFNVTADPWKCAGTVRHEIPAAQGVEVHLLNRRRRVNPAITCLADTVVGYGTRSWELGPGTHEVRDLLLEPGDNVLFVDSKPYSGENTWSDVLSKLGQALTWEQVADMRWAELAKYGQEVRDDAVSTVVIEYKTYDL